MAIEITPKKRSRSQPTIEILPIGGINSDVPSTELAVTESPNSENIIFHKYGAKTRNGVQTLGTQSNLTGIPVGAWEYIQLDQTRHLLVMTTDGAFRYNSSSDWVDMNGSSLLTIAGGATNFADGAFFPQGGTDMFIMTNGVNPPIKYVGGSGDATALGGLTAKGVTLAKFVRSYRDYLLLMYVQISGTLIRQRILWSDIAAPETWSGGHAGQYDILSKGTEIKAHSMLRGVVYIYMEESIVAFVWVGGRDVFRWEIIVPEVGLSGEQTVGEFGDFQIFLGWDNVYIFDGTQHLQPITENILGRGLIDGLNYANVNKAFSIVDKKFGLYSLFVPMGSDYWPRDRWTFDIANKTWSHHRYDNFDNVFDADGNQSGFTGAAHFRRFVGQTWAQLAGTWAAQTWRWSDRDVAPDAPQIALLTAGDTTRGNVLVEAVEATDDNGTVIDSFYETKDFQIGDNTRFTAIEFEAVGNSVDISYSTDEGVSWTAIATQELHLRNYSRYKIYLDVLAQRCRFRFRNNDTDEFFNLRKWRFWSIERR